MKRKFLISLVFTGACLAGIACSELVVRSPHFRNTIGSLCGRGHLLAIAQGQGIYEVDLQRALGEIRYASCVDEKGPHEDNTDNQLVLANLISNSVARSLAVHEEISKAKIASELNLFRRQFRDERVWRTALRASDLSVR